MKIMKSKIFRILLVAFLIGVILLPSLPVFHITLSFPTIDLQSINLHNIHLPKIDLPKINLPEFSFKWPSLWNNEAKADSIDLYAVIGQATATSGTATVTDSPARYTTAGGTITVDTSGLNQTFTITTTTGTTATVTSGTATITSSPKACPAGTVTTVTISNNPGAGATCTIAITYVSTANWSDGYSWSSISGGTPNNHAIPTSTNKVIFNASTTGGAGETFTVNVGASCATLDMSAVTNTPTFAGTQALSIYGSFVGGTVTRTFTGAITFASTAGGNTITSAVVTGGTWNNNVVFNGAGGGWQLLDAYQNAAGTNTFTLTNGTLDTNGQTLTTGPVTFNGGTNALTLGASVWHVYGTWTTTTLGSITPGTSSIRLHGNLTFNGGSKTWYELQLLDNTNNTGWTVVDANTFTNLIITGAAVQISQCYINTNQVITGTFTSTGASAGQRVQVKGNGGIKQVTSAANAFSYTDFGSIVGAGAANWDVSTFTGSSANLLNNTGFTNFPTTVYWVGGSGGPWNVKWSNISGGTAHPDWTPWATSSTVGIDAVIDSNSGLANGTMGDLLASASAVKNISFTPGSGTYINITTSGTVSSVYFDIYGSITSTVSLIWTFAPGVQDGGGIRFRGSGTINMPAGSIVNSGYNVVGGISFDAGTTYTLNSDLYLSGQQTPNWNFGGFNNSSVGGLNTNGKTITCLNATFTGGTNTYYALVMNVSTTTILSGTPTFTNLTIQGQNNFTSKVTIDHDIVVSGAFTSTGYSGSKRLAFASSVSGTQHQITVNGTTNVTNSDFSDSAAVGSASKDISAGLNSDLGGNLGWIFTPGVYVYWVGNSGSWSDPTHWASSSGGVAGSGRIPLIQDMSKFDVNSFAIPGRTVTIDLTNIGGVDTSTVTNNPTITKSGDVWVFGNINFGTSIWTVTNTYFKGQNTISIIGSGSYSFTTNMQVNTNPTYMSAVNFNSAFTILGNLNVVSGTVCLQGFNVTAYGFDSATTTYARAVNLSTGTLTLNNTAVTNKWNVAAANLSIYPGTSTIIFTSTSTNTATFAGAGLTYNNFTIQGSGNYTTAITGNNIFNNFTVDRTLAEKTISGSVSETVSQLYIPISGTRKVYVSNVDFVKTSGTVVTDWLSFTSGNNTCTASGGATWYAGVNSLGSPQTGWNFNSPTAPTATTVAATTIQKTSAQLNMTLDDLGGYGSVYLYFWYGVDPTFAAHSNTPMSALQSGTGAYSIVVSGLAPETTYYFAAVVSDGLSDLVYGAGLSFFTLGTPVVETNGATDLKMTGATLNGTLSSLGDYLTVSVYFEYGPTVGYGTSTAKVNVTTIQVFNSVITGLTNGATYHYRAKGDYVDGVGATHTTNGSDVVFIVSSENVSTSGMSGGIQSAVMPSAWYGSGIGAANLPFYGHSDPDGWGFKKVADDTGISVQTLYLMMMLATVSAVMFGVALFTGSVFLTLGAGVITLGMAVSTTVASGWMVFVLIILGGGVWYLSRQS